MNFSYDFDNKCVKMLWKVPIATMIANAYVGSNISKTLIPINAIPIIRIKNIKIDTINIVLITETKRVNTTKQKNFTKDVKAK